MLFTCFYLTNRFPTSFQNQCSGHVSVLFGPLFLRLLAQQDQSRLQPNTLLQFFILILCCPLLPRDSLGSHLLGKRMSCQFFSRLQISKCANAPILYPDHGSRTSLLLQVLLPVSTSVFLEPVSFKLLFVHDALFSNPGSFCPVLSGQGGEFLLYFEAICFHEQGQRGCALFARCCSHLSPQF